MGDISVAQKDKIMYISYITVHKNGRPNTQKSIRVSQTVIICECHIQVMADLTTVKYRFGSSIYFDDTNVTCHIIVQMFPKSILYDICLMKLN